VSRKRKEVKKNAPQKPNFLFHPYIFFAVFAVWLYITSRNYFHFHSAAPKQISLFFSYFLSSAAGKVIYSEAFLLLRYIWTAILLVSVLTASYIIGKNILGLLKLTYFSMLEKFVFCTGSGLLVFSYLTLLLGSLGFLYRTVYYALLILILLSGFGDGTYRKIFNRTALVNLKSKIRQVYSEKYWKTVFGLILLCLITLNFIMAFAPQIFYDALVYHLGCANYYAVKHKILPMIYNRFSYMPLSMSMLYTMSLLLNGEMLPPLLHFSTGILTVLTCLSFSKRFFNDYSAGLMGGIFFYFVPIVALHSWTCGNDLALAFTNTLCIYALAVWFFGSAGKNLQKRWAMVSAVFAGFTLGIKYSGIFTIIPLPFLILWKFLIKEKYSCLKTLKKLLVYGLISFAVLSPWIIKAWRGTGNPVYPFLNRWLVKNPQVTSGDLTLDYPVFGKIIGGKGASEKDKLLKVGITSIAGSIKKIIVSPWNASIKKSSSYDFIGPIFLMFLPLIVFIKRKKSLVICLILYSIISFCFFGLFTDKFKYYIPALPMLGILAGFVFENIKDSLLPFFKHILLFFIFFVLISNFYYITSFSNSYGVLDALTNSKSRDKYLSRTQVSYPNPSYAVFKYINKNLAESSKILFIGEAKSFSIKRDFVASTVHNKNPIIEWTKRSKTSNGLYDILKKEKITHLLVNLRESIRLVGYNIWYWNDADLKVFDEFWKKRIRKIYYAEGVYLYEILSDEKPRPAPFNFLLALHEKKYARGCLPGIYRENEMWDELIDEYKEYARLGVDAFGQTAWLYIEKKNDYDSAAKILREGIKRYPEKQQYRRMLEYISGKKISD